MTIDMQNYSGEISDSAAENHIAQNSYLDEFQDEVQVHTELLDNPPEEQVPQVEEPAQNVQLSKQELNFKALRDEVERLKNEREQERQDFKQQLELLRANQVQQNVKQESPKRMFEGLGDDDIPSVRDIESAWTKREAEYQARLEEMQVMQKHPDYAEVIEKHLAPLIKEKPYLAEGIQGSSNKALFAYELAKMAQQQKSMLTQAQPAPEAPKINPKAERIIENARKPGSLSNAGGQGHLSKADYYASMSDSEFLQVASKYLGDI